MPGAHDHASDAGRIPFWIHQLTELLLGLLLLHPSSVVVGAVWQLVTYSFFHFGIVDILFAPSVAEMYPDGFSTTIHVSGLTDVMDGAARPGHFDGVATVVAKLFAIVGPDAAYFGQKDAQQVLVVRRVARDLNLPVRIVGCPIVREPDGLAMSSRNVYLDAADRARATALHRALVAAEDVVARGSTSADVILDAARAELRAAGIQPEYLDLRSPDDLTEVDEVAPTALLAVAARVGAARLIDNTILETR